MEALCKELYESQDAGVRSEAEKALVAFQNSPDSLGMFGTDGRALSITLILCREMPEVAGESQLPLLPAVGHHHHHQAHQPVLPEPGAGE